MKQINVTVSGMTTPPVLKTDSEIFAATVVESPSRVIFQLPDFAMGGATIVYGGKSIRVVLPASGSMEGPALIYDGPHLSVIGCEFYRANGERWIWKGCTDFRLPQRMMAGDDIRPKLSQRIDCGANLVRALGMKANNTGWDLTPAGRQDYIGDMRRFFDLLGTTGLSCEWTVFADTRVVMPDPNQQIDFWAQAVTVAHDYPFVLLELVNEAGHPTQNLDPRRFARPSGVLASHGSGLTDEDVVRPLWDYAAYHSRRLQYPTDGRGASNYSPYAYQEGWPKECPYVSDEGPKPEDYGFNVEYARLMGRHAACGAGGTFHSNEGIDSVLWSERTAACARSFFAELK